MPEKQPRAIELRDPGIEPGSVLVDAWGHQAISVNAQISKRDKRRYFYYTNETLTAVDALKPI